MDLDNITMQKEQGKGGSSDAIGSIQQGELRVQGLRLGILDISTTSL